MKSFSFFSRRPCYFESRPNYNYPHLVRGSAMIRAMQMAEYLGGKFNPRHGFENDVLIYVKPYSLDKIPAGAYVDFSDGNQILNELKNHPEIGIIFSSISGYEYIKTRPFKNKLVLIPQHHCNYDREVRSKRKVKTVGVIGSPDSFQQPTEEFRKIMGEMGLDFIIDYSFKNRQDVVDFYKKIDIQVAWNTDKFFNMIYKCPTRLINAASFGIPTVALPESNHQQFAGNYIPIKTMEELINEVRKLKDPDYYSQWSEKIIPEAEPYHISNIAELYRRLL